MKPCDMCAREETERALKSLLRKAEGQKGFTFIPVSSCRSGLFIYLPPKAGFTLAWASPEVGRWSLVTPRRRSNPAPGCTLPRVGVLTWFFCINTAPW